MKLMICGKGGSGKSTISALLAKEFVKKGKSVLVVDTDESNYGLHRQLGLKLPKDFINYFGGKETVLDGLMKAAPTFDCSFFDNKWHLSDVPTEYIAEKDGVKLIAIGKIHEVGEGCACTMGVIAKQFISNLDLNKDEIVITDTEAGVEHFGRSVEQDADAILMVIDPSYESIVLSEKVSELSSSINKPVFFILNKVSNTNKKYMRDGICDKDKIITSISADNNISFAGLIGDELSFEYPEIEKLSKYLTDNLN